MVSVLKRWPGLSISPILTQTRPGQPLPVVSKKSSSTSTYCDIRLITILKPMSCRFRKVLENSRKATIRLTRSVSGCMKRLRCILKRSVWWLLRKRVLSLNWRQKIRRLKYSVRKNLIFKSNWPNSSFNFKRSKPLKVTDPLKISKLFPRWNNCAPKANKTALENPPNYNKTPKLILGSCPRLTRAKRNPSEHIQEYVPQESPETKVQNAHQTPETTNHSKTLAIVLFFTKNPT